MPECKLVETKWLSYAPNKAYRKGLAQYLSTVRQYDVRLWLADYRLAKVVRMVDQEWTAREWLPQFLTFSADIKRMARVQAEDVFSQMSSDSMKRKLDIGGLPFEFSEFRFYDDARSWLLSVDSSDSA
ncbi:hypothetical protein [Pontibacter mangrovi]|uniref:STAS/SEC14 domain-containing protein n=1 Tax=Pontibacter mangrovi TaxID=2589816 RepID=A0A501W6F8_9BACT|nr:hypothetical protein [Pontibacter mangrovi]TPE42397.1 hypothetical protein FJM65_18400 [Pontibacter mangrovi]